MAEQNESNDTLTIRCPNCRQRFSVDDDLMGRMVECGGCDSRFRISDEVILRSKKFYPGERGAADLNRFQRVPLTAASPGGLQPMRYAEFSHPERLEPASPQRIIAGFFGVGIMALMALMLIFGVNPGGTFSVMPLANKLIAAGFTSLLGIVLLLYANPKARLKAGFVGLLLGAGVLCLPFFFTGQAIPGKSTAEADPEAEEPLFPAEEIDPLLDLRSRFVTKPLETERKRLKDAGSDRKAYGIYLTNLVPRNKYVARDFLIRDTGAAPSSHPYPRDNGNYLMVLTEVPLEIGEVAEIASRLGTMEEIHADIGVIVVKVDNDQFIEGSADKLNNSSDPAFYELNRNELENIDSDRVKRAVVRLTGAEPTIYRTDITRRLIELLGKPGVTFHDELAKALLIWAEDPTEAAVVGLGVLRGLVGSENSVPESLVDLVARAELQEAIPVISDLWIKAPTLWEKYYSKLGPAIVPGVLEQLGSEDAVVRRSAIRILGSLGTREVLPVLQRLSSDPDSEVRLLADRAIAKINAN